MRGRAVCGQVCTSRLGPAKVEGARVQNEHITHSVGMPPLACRRNDSVEVRVVPYVICAANVLVAKYL